MNRIKLFSLLVFSISVVVIACSGQPDPSSMTEAQLTEYARGIHDRIYTIDTHVDIAGAQYATEELDPGIDNPKLKVDLVKMVSGGVDGTFLAVYVRQKPELDDEAFKWAQEEAGGKFNAIHRLTDAMYPDRCALAVSADEFERLAATGKRVIMIGIENGYPIGRDLSMLQHYYDLGTRYITLSHSGHNQICDSSSPENPMYNGLSDFGREVIPEMNRLGIMIDISHTSIETVSQVLELTKAPVIASHSSCFSLEEVDRNLNDEQLKALAANGGVIHITAVASFIKGMTPEMLAKLEALASETGMPWSGNRPDFAKANPEQQKNFLAGYEVLSKENPQATVQDFVDHIDHAVKVAGIDHVGIGSDFDGGGAVAGFFDYNDAPNVTLELVKRGYSEEEIAKIWGGNLLRVWREVERISKELQSTN